MSPGRGRTGEPAGRKATGDHGPGSHGGARDGAHGVARYYVVARGSPPGRRATGKPGTGSQGGARDEAPRGSPCRGCTGEPGTDAMGELRMGGHVGAREEESWGSTWDGGQGGSHWGGSRRGAGRGTGCYGAGKTGIRGPRGCSGRACRAMRVCRRHGGAARRGDAMPSGGRGTGATAGGCGTRGPGGSPAGGGSHGRREPWGKSGPRPWGHGSGTLDICQRLWSGSSHPYGQRLGVDNRDTIFYRVDACAERFIPPPGERCIPPPVNKASLC